MAIEDREREKCPAGVVEPDEGGVGNDVERLLAAILGMRAPADIREETCGMSQPLLLGPFLDAGRSHEPVGPVDQFLAVPWRARAEDIEIVRGDDQRILAPRLLVEQLVEQPFPHAERGDNDPLRPADA